MNTTRVSNIFYLLIHKQRGSSFYMQNAALIQYSIKMNERKTLAKFLRIANHSVGRYSYVRSIFVSDAYLWRENKMFNWS